jgi:hypothetical protein
MHRFQNHYRAFDSGLQEGALEFRPLKHQAPIYENKQPHNKK